MNYIESHCHLTDDRVYPDAESWVVEAMNAGVDDFVLAGVKPQDWMRQLELRASFKKNPNGFYPRFYVHFGVHPWQVEKMPGVEIEQALESIRSQVSKIDGIGETGLDFAEKRDEEKFGLQENIFRAHLKIAREHSKPIILHVVHAHARAIAILKEENAQGMKLIMHSYSGNVTELQEYLNLGAMISYCGAIVSEVGYEKVKKSLTHTPHDRILFETDSPDQYWGEGLNRPVNLVQVYEAGAKLLKIPIAELQKKVAENFGKIGYVKTP